MTAGQVVRILSGHVRCGPDGQTPPFRGLSGVRLSVRGERN